MGPSNAFVVLFGFGTVLVGLVCIVLIVELMHLIVTKVTSKSKSETSAPAVNSAPAEQPIENRQEIIAVVSAVLAEELGTDVSAIRIHSFKKIN